MDALNELILQSVASPWLLLILFAVTVIDGFFPPVPSETVLVAAAAVSASSGGANIIVLCAVAAVGAMVGDNIAYALGRKIGTRRFGWMRRQRVAAAFETARGALQRGGAGFLLGARHIPVGRVAVNMTAGAVRYSWRRFLPLSLLGAVTWAAFSTCLGLLAGQWLRDQPLLSAGIGVLLAVVIGVTIDRLTARRRRHRHRHTGSGSVETESAADAAARQLRAPAR